MKINHLLPLPLLCLVFELQAQPAKVLRIKNGQNATKYIPARDRFQYEAFQSGKIACMNGTYAQARFKTIVTFLAK